MKNLKEINFEKTFVIVTFFSLLFSMCGKKEEVEPSLDISSFKASGGQIWGEFKVDKADDVADRGVVISLSSGATFDNNMNSVAKISLIDNYYIFNDLKLDTTYYIKGYTKSKKGIVKYSNEMPLKTECLQIDSIAPVNLVQTTTQITIYGKNFSNNLSDNTVTFKGDCINGSIISLTPTSGTSNSLVINVSGMFKTGSCDFYVFVDKPGDDCDAGGSILSKIDKSSSGYTFHYTGDLIYSY